MNMEIQNSTNDHSLPSHPSLLPSENNPASTVHINNSLLSQHPHQQLPSQAANPAITNSYQQIYLSSFANLSSTRNIWIKRDSDIDATKIPFSGEDIHDLKVCILQFFGPEYIGSSAELGFVTVWKDGKKLTPGQMVDAELLKNVTCENPLLLKNTHQVQTQSQAQAQIQSQAQAITTSSSSSPTPSNRPTTSNYLDLESNKSLSLDAATNETLLLSSKQNKEPKSTVKSKDPQLTSNKDNNDSVNPSNHTSNEDNDHELSNLKQRQSLSTSLPEQNLLKSLQLQSNLLPVNGLTGVNLNNISNGLSLQELANLNGITNLNNLNLLNGGGGNGNNSGSNSPTTLRQTLRQLNGLTNTNINNIVQLSQQLTQLNNSNASHQSDEEDPVDPEEQINAIYPPFMDIPKEIEDAVHRNTHRGWRLITIIETNDIPKFFEDQPQDWRVQRSATDRYPGFLVINYIGGLEGERNNMPSKSLNLSWDPETNDPSSKKYRKAKDLIDKQSMMYGSRFFCKGYPWCPSIASSKNAVTTETTEFGKGGKKLAKRIKSSMNQSVGVAASSPPPSQSGDMTPGSIYRSGNSILLEGQSNSMKRNFDCIHPENHDSTSSVAEDGKSTNNAASHRALKLSCNATLKIEIYASNLKKAVIYGKNLHGILGPISEFRPSDRIMSEACRAALSKDITYNRFLRQAEAMAIKYNIPKHRIPNRTQIRTFFERSRRGSRITPVNGTSNSESPSINAAASLTSNHRLLNNSLVSVSSIQSYINQQQQEQTSYASSLDPSTSKVSPTQSHLQLHSPNLTLSNYQTTPLSSSNLMDRSVDDVDVDMYSNNDLGIIKIPSSFNSITNSINFANGGLSGITASIANDLTTGINTSIFNHTTSSNSSNSNSNTSNFHSNLFNS